MSEALIQKTVERQGAKSEPYVRHYPQVIAGICEFCGVMDKNQPSQVQYKLCSHYKGMQLRCSYCDESKDPDEVIYKATLNITDHPTSSGELVVCCDAYTCLGKHQARFQR
jgi:hypothetical protein